MSAVRLSLLDQSPAGVDGPGAAIRASVRRAALAERTGLHRIWFAEHHGHAAFAGSSPLVLASAALASTGTIRVGTGGVLAGFQGPRHVAAAFSTLERTFPGRVDAGLGRANAPLDDYVRHTQVVADLLADDGPPLWILGIGARSARQAEALGAGYAHGHFFNPVDPHLALLGRVSGLPDLVAARVVVRDTEDAARSAAEQFVAWRTRRDLGVDEPLPGSPTPLSGLPAGAVRRNLAAVLWGTATRVADQLHGLADVTGADEVMMSLPEPDPVAQAVAIEQVATAFGEARLLRTR